MAEHLLQRRTYYTVYAILMVCTYLTWQVAYFESRMTGRIDQALALKLHARKRVLAFTRAENERRGRVIRSWGDGF